MESSLIPKLVENQVNRTKMVLLLQALALSLYRGLLTDTASMSQASQGKQTGRVKIVA